MIFAGQTLGNPLTPQRSNQNVNVSDTVRIWAFQNADYDWHTSISIATCRSSTRRSASSTRPIPICKKFKAHGGKLLLYAGWGDTDITPKNTVRYYESVVNKMGKNETNDFDAAVHGARHGPLPRRRRPRHVRLDRHARAVAREGR